MSITSSLPTIKRFESNTGVRVYRIACQVFPDLTGRVYLLLGAGPPTLVDTGSGRAQCTQQILSALEQIPQLFKESLQPKDIRRIFITHARVDHIGGLSALVAHTGAEVAVHPLDSRAVANYDEHVVVLARRMLDFFRRAGVSRELHDQLILNFGLVRGRVTSTRVDFPLTDGQELDGLRIIHTPGHSPGHVCIAAGNILVCADHVLPVTVPHPWPESALAYAGLGHYFESLDKLQAVPGLTLGLGGHEAPIEDLYARIRQIRDTHLRRLDRVLQLVRYAADPVSVSELAERMYMQARGVHTVVALMDICCRVEYLYQRGQLAIANLDEIEQDEHATWRYKAI